MQEVSSSGRVSRQIPEVRDREETISAGGKTMEQNAKKVTRNSLYVLYEHGYDWSAIASMLSVSARSVYRWIKGENIIPLDRFLLLSDLVERVEKGEVLMPRLRSLYRHFIFYILQYFLFFCILFFCFSIYVLCLCNTQL